MTIKKSPNFENKFFADFRKNNQLLIPYSLRYVEKLKPK
ncbi:hypothetical protein T12_12422 [Trichinella patagoniensis]|uniref:Uncharacterized protein n=1 Tax=Trichinella patagoniensis TaxID=990121 RepID=A0A0V0YW38_9BILA|nr:hypothetical protein T12_12422 [Trichinella patagoniensis]